MTLFTAGKRSAFSILDDADDPTLKNIEPVCVVLRSVSRNFFAAEAFQDKAYLPFVHGLVQSGSEVACKPGSGREERASRDLPVTRGAGDFEDLVQGAVGSRGSRMPITARCHDCMMASGEGGPDVWRRRDR